MTTEQTVLWRARRAYEFARLRRALLAAIPVVALLSLVTLLVTRPVRATGFGAVVLVAGVWSLWRGLGLQHAFSVGVLSGMVPVLFVTSAMRFPHHCGTTACVSVCLWAAAAGGLVGGGLVAAWRHRARPAGFHVALASAVGVLTGAMACACIGWPGVGVLGLTGGLSVGFGALFLKGRTS